jgi:Beta protein
MPHRYLPMLRSRAGETVALNNLTGTAKNRMMPVFHLVHKPPNNFGAAIIAAWGGRRLALDGTFQTNTTGTVQGFTLIFDQIGRTGLNKVRIIPCIEHGTVGQYLTAVRNVYGRYAPGLVVKAKLNQPQAVQGWVRAQGWALNETDLVVTLGEIATLDPATLVPAVTTTITTHIASPPPWRSITLSSSAAPKDYGGLPLGRTDVPRLDWQVWQGVVASQPPFQIDYADYSTISPELTDPPGYVMPKATVSVRYTIDDFWIILKGRATTGRHGQPMLAQYRAHARTLVADPNFGGLVGCWADGRIQQIAAGAHSAGGRPQWAGYAANRHLSFIADRLP